MTPSPIAKRSIVIAGHKTSVSLEDPFWVGLNEIANAQNISLSKLVADIDSRRELGNLSSTLRLFVLDHFRASRNQAGQDHAGQGHAEQGHAGNGTVPDVRYEARRSA